LMMRRNTKSEKTAGPGGKIGLPQLTVVPQQLPASKGAAARMQAYLLQCAMELTNRGHAPSVSEVAEGAGVSRATAYRYFPSQSKLVAAITNASLGPVRQWSPRSTDGPTRVRELFDETIPRFHDFEPQLRAALAVALQHWSLERAGQLKEEPYRRGYRRGILGLAVEPMKAQLGKANTERLAKALSVVYGIEPYVVLKDIWGTSAAETEAITRWIADAILEKAVLEGNAKPTRKRTSKRKHIDREEHNV
jgi:AcrR family transcriptional regulator